MIKLTDELIMAYVDGELEEKQADEIRKAIEKNPEALKRVKIFSDSAAMLKGIYDAPINEAVPERLIKTVKNNQTDKMISRIRDFLNSFLRIQSWPAAYGMSLFLALLFGIGGGDLTFNMISLKSDSYTMMLTGKEFGQGLETTISGQSFTLADHAIKVTPVATFQNKARRYCRQYEVLTSQNKQNNFSQGIACRNQSGKWQTCVYITSIPFETSTIEQNTNYIPAGMNELIDDITDRLMTSPPMTRKQEAELISKGWN